MAVNDDVSDEDWGAWGKSEADNTRTSFQSQNSKNENTYCDPDTNYTTESLNRDLDSESTIKKQNKNSYRSSNTDNCSSNTSDYNRRTNNEQTTDHRYRGGNSRNDSRRDNLPMERSDYRRTPRNDKDFQENESYGSERHNVRNCNNEFSERNSSYRNYNRKENLNCDDRNISGYRNVVRQGTSPRGHIDDRHRTNEKFTSLNRSGSRNEKYSSNLCSYDQRQVERDESPFTQRNNFSYREHSPFGHQTEQCDRGYDNRRSYNQIRDSSPCNRKHNNYQTDHYESYRSNVRYDRNNHGGRRTHLDGNGPYREYQGEERYNRSVNRDPRENFGNSRFPENNRSGRSQIDSNRYNEFGEDITNDFQRTMRFHDDENDHDDEDGKFPSRTFSRGQKFSQIDDLSTNTNDDTVPAPKRATYVPNDDEEDYELHVNSGINFDNYDKIPVELNGDDAPESIDNFKDLNLSNFLIANLRSLHYRKLTPVQKSAIPIIFANRDLMACAQTGSGKTAAFLIPIIQNLHSNPMQSLTNSRVVFPRALILAPTRELCRQIFTVARNLCRGSKVIATYVYGGIQMNKSRSNIQSAGGADIVVATTGRLMHFLELEWISLRHLKYFVLDEADRMLDSDGFYESVNKIYDDVKRSGDDDDRSIQISMFSATFPNEVQSLAGHLLNNYLFLAVGVVGSANSDVKQEIIQSDNRDKLNAAIDYIKNIPSEKTLIFVDTKRMADFFGIKLGYMGFKTTTIHGDREQEQRETALNDFKSGRVNIMVATNVAARGLDIPKVDNVINIDLPSDIDTYIHRIGRTGRCGNVGRAISFFDEVKDAALAPGLIAKLQEANQECPDWLRSLCSGSKNGANSVYQQFSRDTRKNVKVNRFVDNNNRQRRGGTGDGDDFMRGTNVDYDEGTHTSEWIED